MSPVGKTVKELKITAALYASRHGVLDYVRATGRLLRTIDMGGAEIGLRLLIERRGTDIALTPDEQLVYDALMRGKRLPGGSAVLVETARKTPHRKKHSARAKTTR